MKFARKILWVLLLWNLLVGLYASGVLQSFFKTQTKKPPFVAVGFYTSDYEEYAELLRASCELVGVHYHLVRLPEDHVVESANVESDNQRHVLLATKPSFILHMMDKHKTPILYMDIDLQFKRYPVLFNESADVDVMLPNWNGHGALLTSSGISFWNTTDQSRDLLRKWHYVLSYSTNRFAADDQVLDTLDRDHFALEGMRMRTIPFTYLCIIPWKTAADVEAAFVVHPRPIHLSPKKTPVGIPAAALRSARTVKGDWVVMDSCGNYEDGFANYENEVSIPSIITPSAAAPGRGVKWACKTVSVFLAHTEAESEEILFEIVLGEHPRLSVEQQQQRIIATAAASRYKLLGCFRDDKNDRDLSDIVALDSSPSDCSQVCRATYFGIQLGRECWCGNEYGKYGEDPTGCVPCGHGEECGQANYNAIYSRSEHKVEFDVIDSGVRVRLPKEARLSFSPVGIFVKTMNIVPTGSE